MSYLTTHHHGVPLCSHLALPWFQLWWSSKTQRNDVIFKKLIEIPRLLDSPLLFLRCKYRVCSHTRPFKQTSLLISLRVGFIEKANFKIADYTRNCTLSLLWTSFFLRFKCSHLFVRNLVSRSVKLLWRKCRMNCACMWLCIDVSTTYHRQNVSVVMAIQLFYKLKIYLNTEHFSSASMAISLLWREKYDWIHVSNCIAFLLKIYYCQTNVNPVRTSLNANGCMRITRYRFISSDHGCRR